MSRPTSRRNSADVDTTFEPLDQLRIEVEQDGRTRSVSALHIGWAAKRTFAHYCSPPKNFPGVCTTYNQTLAVDQEIWLERMEMLKQDLIFLLNLPHHRFWSQVIYHEDVHEAFESYLLNAPRLYDLPTLLTEEMTVIQNEVHRFVFLVFLRMATYKENKTCHITPEVFGTLIYDYFLYDIPKIMDLCALFSPHNKKLLVKMVNNIFSNQPKYKDDLQKAVGKIFNVFSTIVDRFGLSSTEYSEVSSRICKLSRSSQPPELTWPHFLDIFLYFLDTCATLHRFLDVYPAACQVFFVQKFPAKIASFYSSVVPFLIKELNRRKERPETSVILVDVISRLSVARNCLLKTFRQIIETCCIQPLLEKDFVMENGPCVDDYFEIMTGILSEKSFMVDYEQRYAFTEDVDLFIQTGLFLDNSRISYITDGIQMLLQECCNGSSSNIQESERAVNSREIDAKKPVYQKSIAVASSSNEEKADTSSTDFDASCVAQATDLHLDSLICQVKELLPDYEDGFIELCLEHYNYKPENVINAILENSLPSNLQKADPQMSRKTKVVDNRANIYDNDEMDIFSNNNVDLSRIHKGKWSHQNKHLDEESKNVDLKRVTLMLSTKLQLESDREGREDLYEDEYDDTYDEQMINVNESSAWDELLERRPFVTPNVLRVHSDVKDANRERFDEEADEDDSVPVADLPKRDEFVTNPEVERERAAQKRRESGRGSYKRHDVKGRPKGQGQDAQVTANRENKERNKTFRGNHNRKSMADRKRSRGMFPS